MDAILRLLSAMVICSLLVFVAPSSALADNNPHKGGLVGESAEPATSATTNQRSAILKARRVENVRVPTQSSSTQAKSLPTSPTNAFLDLDEAVAAANDPLGRIPLVEADAHALPEFQAQPAAEVAQKDGDAAGGPALTVTVEDVARFLPAAATMHAEPNGWAVLDVPANFWTVAHPATVEGELLGEEASVRFTPRLYRWNYGDGSVRTTRSGGSSWADAGQQELAATATSHNYREKSTRDASVTVGWTAEYRFAGGDWIPIAGGVSNSSLPVRMLVVKERTVLTAG